MRLFPRPFFVISARAAALVALSLLGHWASPCPAQSPAKAPKSVPLITGIRTWRFVDGTSLRFAVLEVRGEVVNCRVAGGKRASRPLSAFAPEHKADLEKIRKQEVKVAEDTGAGIPRHSITPVGVPPFAPNLSERPEEYMTRNPVGLPRKWTRTDGKTVEGCLLNVTDDQVAIWINNRSYPVPVDMLDKDSLDYLQRTLKGEELMIPLKFEWGSASLAEAEGNWTFRAYVPNDRAAIGYKNAVTFEVAFTKAREFMEEKVGDLSYWKLEKVEEFNWWNHPNTIYQPPAWKEATERPSAGRIFWFTTKDTKALKLAAQKIPKYAVPLRQSAYAIIPVFADGDISLWDSQR